MIGKILQKYRIVILALVAVVLFAGGAFTGYSFCKSSQYKDIIKQQEKDAELVMKHETKKDQAVENVSKAKTVIRKIKDPSGCLDTDSPRDYIDGLLNADREAESGFN